MQIAMREVNQKTPSCARFLEVSACLEPGAVLSEIARSAGIPVSQLFRWRKELCRIEEPSKQVSSKLVPVIVSEAAPAAQPAASEAPASLHPRRKRSDVTIDLGRGRRVRVRTAVQKSATEAAE